MIVSELIALLADTKEEHGDLKVQLVTPSDYGGCHQHDVQQIVVSRETWDKERPLVIEIEAPW